MRKSLSKGDRIIVKFPSGTAIPQKIDTSKVFINGEPVSNASINNLEVSIYSTMNVASGETVEVKFDKEVGIITPKSPGEIKLGYKLQGNSDFYYTLGVNLTEAKLEVGDFHELKRNRCIYK